MSKILLHRLIDDEYRTLLCPKLHTTSLFILSTCGVESKLAKDLACNLHLSKSSEIAEIFIFSVQKKLPSLSKEVKRSLQLSCDQHT